jgi:hypothetical protein
MLKTDKEFFKKLDPSKVSLEKIPMPWDDQLTHVDKISMAEQDITMNLDNLKELGVPRHVVIRFLIQEIKDIFGGK